MKNLFVSSHSFSHSTELKAYTQKNLNDFNINFNASGKSLSQKQLIDQASDADVILVGHEPVDRNLFEALPKLNIIAKYGVGLDNINQEDCFCLLYTSPSPRDQRGSRMPSSA